MHAGVSVSDMDMLGIMVVCATYCVIYQLKKNSIGIPSQELSA